MIEATLAFTNGQDDDTLAFGLKPGASIPPAVPALQRDPFSPMFKKRLQCHIVALQRTSHQLNSKWGWVALYACGMGPPPARGRVSGEEKEQELPCLSLLQHLQPRPGSLTSSLFALVAQLTEFTLATWSRAFLSYCLNLSHPNPRTLIFGPYPQLSCSAEILEVCAQPTPPALRSPSSRTPPPSTTCFSSPFEHDASEAH